MIIRLSSFVAMFFVVLSCKTFQNDQPFNSTLATAEGTKYICGNEITLRSDDGKAIKYLPNNTSLKSLEETKEDNGHKYLKVEEASEGTIGWIATQFISDSECKAKYPVINGAQICEYSWEQAKGYTDYVIWDNYRRVNYHNPDRGKTHTLVESGRQGGRSLCQKAEFLKPCFYKAVASAKHPLALEFLSWSKRYSVKPERLLMAIAEQETKLGALKDQGVNGVGLNQIVTAFKSKNSLVSDNDHATWAGITHNILTNLDYSMRALGVKEMENGPGNIYNLALHYNGSSEKHHYAKNVEKFYYSLRSCGL